MLHIPNLLLIGGNAHNVGKTTLAIKIIGKLAKHNDVIGVKVTTFKPSKESCHGSHDILISSNSDITEELGSDSQKDTARMLMAGASRSFYITASDALQSESIQDILTRINLNQPIICESRSLRNFVKPGLFVMMLRQMIEAKPKDVTKFVILADKIFDHNQDAFLIDQFVDKLDFRKGEFVSQYWD